MKELVIISGKGGTGKTSLIAGFASLAKNKVLCDADVDAADLHLITAPKILETHEFEAGHMPIIHQDKCTQCGLCRELCRWDAISTDFIVDTIECEGCGVCYYFCPEDAISFPANICGEWFISDTRFGPMAHAILGYAEENSGRLVTLVRNLATDLASGQAGNPETPDSLSGRIIIDGSPGTGCPVIASVSGANFAVVVTEPTVSGLHDLVRVFDLTRHFRVATGVIVNKADLNEEMTERIRTATLEAGARFLGTVPYDAAFTRAQIRRQTLLEQGDGPAAQAVREIWEEIADSR